MKPAERDAVVTRYAERLQRLGPVVQALGWRDRAQQDLRFSVIADGLRHTGDISVLDIGCGFGDLYPYLRERGDVRYVGCDLSPDLLAVARTRYPDVTFDQRDPLAEPYPDEAFDYVCMSGIFNHPLEDNEAFVEEMLRAAYRTCVRGVAANMMIDQVDYHEDHLHYFNPERVLGRCRGLSRYVALRHDYPLFEFTVFIYRDGHS